MSNFFTKILPQNSPNLGASEPDQFNNSIRVIGYRSSGKTTYMAALARWPNADPLTSTVQQVIPINEDGENLIAQAQNILEQGDTFKPSDLQQDTNAIPDYAIQIVLKDQFSWRKLASGTAPTLSINVNCKDYAGEFFQDLLRKTGTTLLEEYIDDCCQADGIMLMVDGLSYKMDAEYANLLDRFLTELDRSDVGFKKRRIALILTKCEQSELWINRHQPQKIASVRFSKVYSKLTTWQFNGSGTFECFMTSAFGMLGNSRPKPNVNLIKRDREGISSVIQRPDKWKPFGLVAPIYWLSTGQKHPDLDKE
jgi:GTPase SAR1 family protein